MDKSRDDREALERIEERSERRGWSDRRVDAELERIRKEYGDDRAKGTSERDKLARLDRIAETDSMRRMRGFDVDRARRLEDMEIRTNHRGFLRRHEDQGLDPATEREVFKAIERRKRA